MLRGRRVVIVIHEAIEQAVAEDLQFDTGIPLRNAEVPGDVLRGCAVRQIELGDGDKLGTSSTSDAGPTGIRPVDVERVKGQLVIAPQAEQQLILVRRGRGVGIDIAGQQSKVVGGKLEANLLGRVVAYQHFVPVVGAGLGPDVSATEPVRAVVVLGLEVAVGATAGGPNTQSHLVWVTAVIAWISVT